MKRRGPDIERLADALARMGFEEREAAELVANAARRDPGEIRGILRALGCAPRWLLAAPRRRRRAA